MNEGGKENEEEKGGFRLEFSRILRNTRLNLMGRVAM